MSTSCGRPQEGSEGRSHVDACGGGQTPDFCYECHKWMTPKCWFGPRKQFQKKFKKIQFLFVAADLLLQSVVRIYTKTRRKYKYMPPTSKEIEVFLCPITVLTHRNVIEPNIKLSNSL